MKDNDIKHLEWVYERMKYVHSENENYDYMIRFREILEALKQPVVISSACDEILIELAKNNCMLHRTSDELGFLVTFDLNNLRQFCTKLLKGNVV